MSKKVTSNGIEILATEDQQSARILLGFVEIIITRLETSLDNSDENFNLSIDTYFSPTSLTKFNISMDGLTNPKTREKVVNILRKSTETGNKQIKGTFKVELHVTDG